MLGLTQAQVATAIGVSFQQLQKYETGESHLTLQRAVRVSKALSMSVSELVEGLEAAETSLVTPIATFLGTTLGRQLVRSALTLNEKKLKHLIILALSLKNEDNGDGAVTQLSTEEEG